MPKLKEQPYQIIIALDQLFNALTWGWADETFSARCWRQRNKNRFWALSCKFVNTLFWWDKTHLEGKVLSHCEWAFFNEWGDAHKPSYKDM